jgi:hypothetical protein
LEMIKDTARYSSRSSSQHPVATSCRHGTILPFRSILRARESCWSMCPIP